MRVWNDFSSWAQSHEGKVLSYLVYKRMYTPYEQQQAFSDEDEYTDCHYESGVLVEAVCLGEDWLLGFRSIDVETMETYGFVQYYRLSEIRLAKFDSDQSEEE